MTSSRSVRVRFAPSPTGMMHLGNVRAALLNYLFAQQKNGTFILRIEDTDQERNFDPQGTKIIEDLLWLGLDYEEGPIKGGHYEPYFQSKRTAIYQEKLTLLEHRNLVYRCFCTVEELEKKRQRQLALKLPPRYDRECLKLTPEKIQEKLAAKQPFIWRFKLNQDETIQIQDLARGTITFDFKNFSDFAVSRTDGSFTFMFANFVDDMVMVISHVIRGEDHLTNTAGQAALYKAFGIEIPIFWHLPIITNMQGQKLSKRDFGFSLNDLKESGFLPEAINNYLALIGGGTFEKEIMNRAELAKAMNFDSMHSTGQIRYDVEKLRWMNHKWIEQLSIEELSKRCLPYIAAKFPQATAVAPEKLQALIAAVKTDLVMLADAPAALAFYFENPVNARAMILEHISQETMNTLQTLLSKNESLLERPKEFLDTVKQESKNSQVPMKDLFTFMRIALTSTMHGPALHDIMSVLGSAETKKRLFEL